MDRLIEGHLKQTLDTIKHIIVNPDGFQLGEDKQEITTELETIETLFHLRLGMDYAGPVAFNEIWDYYEVHCLSDVLRNVFAARRVLEANEKHDVKIMNLYILIYRAYYWIHGSYTSKPPLERIADALEEMRDYYVKGDQDDKQ